MSLSRLMRLDNQLRALFRQWDKRFDDYAKHRARWFAQRVNVNTMNQLAGSLRDAGLTVKFRNSRRVNNIVQSIVSENVNLIRSIPRQFLT